tara:strand:- start:681 stop:791 length:111 start_codon:yes stop_codon:yes gene_type:complete
MIGSVILEEISKRQNEITTIITREKDAKGIIKKFMI